MKNIRILVENLLDLSAAHFKPVPIQACQMWIFRKNGVSRLHEWAWMMVDPEMCFMSIMTPAAVDISVWN